MTQRQKIAASIVVLLILGALYGLWQTRPMDSSVTPATAKKNGASGNSGSNVLVDQSPLKTAQNLAQLAATPEERALAQEAIRLADYEVDLAFDTALSKARLHPPALSDEAKKIEEQLQKAEKLLKEDQDRAKQLAEQLVKLPEDKQESVQVDLIQAEADVDLDQDEVDDAKQDLTQAGGNLADRIQALRKEHEEIAHKNATAVSNVAMPEEKWGLIHRFQQWKALHEKQMQLWEAKAQAEAASVSLAAQHNKLDEAVDAAKEKLPELAHHSKKHAELLPANRMTASKKSDEESSALLKRTEQIAADQKNLAALDRRSEAQKELSGIYGQWIALVAVAERHAIHFGLLGVLAILGIALLGVFVSAWLDRLLGQVSTDRRQIQSLRTVSRVSLQVAGLLLILLAIFGPPGQLGTFLGLAGAGLTVALKDFIVGFIGWFVLMGKNGIRLGDWVEINGVTGEVVEIGPFHTVLLETGNWTDSGHPTGRRVTFTNSFAIEGHYFNFSTTGQWLWDELQLVLPAGQDPYPLVDAFMKKVGEATQQTAQQAEEEWRRSTSSNEMSGFSASPAVSVRPVLGGIEVSVRYITRANERYLLRSKLNQSAVELLGAKTVAATPPA